MAKHLIGFGLFTGIVGFFVTVFWIFSSKPLTEVSVFEARNSVGSWTYCDKKRRPKDVGEPRAIADRLNGTVTLYLNDVPGAKVGSDEVSASFTFYAVGGSEVQMLDVINDSLVKAVRRDAGTKWTLQYDAPWIKTFPADVNLYVVPASSGAVPAKFSVDSAMPVLIKN